MDRRYQDVAGPVVAELNDQLGQVGLPRVDPGRGQRLVQLDLLGEDRLDLDDLRRSFSLYQSDDDSVGLLGVAGPVHHRSGRGGIGLERFQMLVETVQCDVLDGLSGEP